MNRRLHAFEGERVREQDGSVTFLCEEEKYRFYWDTQLHAHWGSRKLTPLVIVHKQYPLPHGKKHNLYDVEVTDATWAAICLKLMEGEQRA